VSNQETFTVDAYDLVRSVVSRNGTTYEHRCTLASLVAISHTIDEWSDELGRGFALHGLRHAAKVPLTQAAVALAFLREHCIVTPVHGRRHVAAEPGSTHLNAMIEFHALREGAPTE
jgi:hypothetical protein